MQVLPLLYHAMLRVPQLSERFGVEHENVPLSVTDGGDMVLTFEHGLAVGFPASIIITYAPVPNPISGVEIVGENAILTTTERHDYTDALPGYDPDNRPVVLTGFDDAGWNGSFDLVAAPDAHSVVIKAPGDEPTLTGEERLQEDVDDARGLFVTTPAESGSLAIPSPSSVRRDFVGTATIVTDLRMYATLDLDSAVATFTAAGDDAGAADAHLFIVPPAKVTASRRKGTNTDATAEPGSGQDHRTTIVDGFSILVMEAVDQDKGAVNAIERAQGEAFTAIMRTFNGLQLPEGGLTLADRNVSNFVSHEAVYFNGAAYGHLYSFESVYSVADGMTVPPTDWTAVDDVTKSHIARIGLGFPYGDDRGEISLGIGTDVGPQKLKT